MSYVPAWTFPSKMWALFSTSWWKDMSRTIRGLGFVGVTVGRISRVENKLSGTKMK